MRPGPAGLGSEEGRARTALAALGADGSGGKVIAAPESLGDSGGLECSAGEVGAHPDMRGEAMGMSALDMSNTEGIAQMSLMKADTLRDVLEQKEVSPTSEAPGLPTQLKLKSLHSSFPARHLGHSSRWLPNCCRRDWNLGLSRSNRSHRFCASGWPSAPEPNTVARWSFSIAVCRSGVAGSTAICGPAPGPLGVVRWAVSWALLPSDPTSACA
mmetsp:Transcript_61991/g.102356  ORF Transcript_61991/g.102356 Transcript_61991/m.102356 type:complete len:214 (-) Transcript_61991:306-947(-)